MNKKNKLVQGVGINDYEGSISVNGRIIKSYQAWKDMLKRCYSEKYQIKKPTYIGCTVADEWLYFSNFKKWFDENYVDGYQLDKDLKYLGNKVYSKEACFFVTRELNSLFTNNRRNKGECQTGVSFHKCKGRYRSTVRVKGRSKWLGLFSTSDEAEKVYLTAKGNEVIRQAMLPTTPDGLRESLIKRGNRMLIGETE